MKNSLNNAFFSILVGALVSVPSLLHAAVPTATSVEVLGQPLYNATPNPDQFTIVTGEYVYDDTDADLEGATTFQWYRSLNSDGTGLTSIAGATAQRYSITSGDIGYYLYFQVTPVDANGDAGSAVTSGASPIVASTTYTDNTFGTTTISATTNYLNAGVSGNNRTITVTGSTTVVTIYGDFDMGSANGTIINVSNGATLIIHGGLEIRNNLTINVDATSTFTISSNLEAKNGAGLTVSGNLTVEGDLDVEQTATITVSDGGSMDVQGDFTSGDNGTVTIEGAVTVGGNMEVGGGTDIIVDNDNSGGGSLAVTGDLTGGTGATISGFGPVNVGGDVRGDPGFAGDSQLPIELLSFRVEKEGNTVVVSWSTASETNNEVFTIERSTDGRNYEALAEVAGAGTSQEVNHYAWTDHNPVAGKSYYRLRQTDYDGQNETFNAAVIDGVKVVAMRMYPNPVQDQVTIQWAGGEETYLSVMDMQGRRVFAQAYGETTTQAQVPVQNWEAGVYLVKTQSGGQTQTLRLVVQ